MIKSAIIRARVEPKVKTKVEYIFGKLGLSTSEAINLFLKQVCLHQGLPFEVKMPNDALRKSIEDSRKGVNVVKSETPEEMFDKLGNSSKGI